MNRITLKTRLAAAALLLAAAVQASCQSTATAPANGEKAAATAPIRYGPGRQLATLANRRIAESSGIAASRLRDGVFWTHNDSDDGPRLYAFDKAGRDLGSVTLEGAKARDWEDIASFERGGKSWLLVGDIGNNLRDQKTGTLYLVPEPAIDPDNPADTQVAPAVTIRFSYADGPQDCEALAVDATAGKIYLAAKALLPLCKIYELPLSDEQPAEPLTARHVATVTISLATGMDISPDGRRMVICNYSEAAELTRHEDESWAKALDRLPRRLGLPSRRQGEAICYGSDGRSLYLTSEQLPTPLLELPAQDGPRD